MTDNQMLLQNYEAIDGLAYGILTGMLLISISYFTYKIIILLGKERSIRNKLVALRKRLGMH